MNPRRYSQIERALQILDKSGTVDILKEDQYLLFLFKKTERIVAALYVVTGLFPDAEPLKWALRESGSSLIGHTLSFKERAAVHSREFLSDTLSEIARLFSLLDIAHVADLISPMNFSVLRKELEATLSIIEGKWRTGTLPISQPFLDEAFFGITKEMFTEPKEHKNDLSLRVPFVDGEEALGTFGAFERLKRSQKDMHKGHLDVRDNVLERKPETLRQVTRSVPNSLAVRPLVDQTKEERKRHILAVLTKQSSAMIKDFSAVITDCSEKTIQRLLIEMVESGVLKREGDRRWSRYTLADKKIDTGTVS